VSTFDHFVDLHPERGMSRQQRVLQQTLSNETGLEVTSAVMVARLLSLERGYRKSLFKAFRAVPHQVDFTRANEAVDIINAWVSDHTAGIASHAAKGRLYV